MSFQAARKLLAEGVSAGVFPGAAAGVARIGRSPEFFCEGRTRLDARGTSVAAGTYFDLASVTKVLVTTTILARWLDRKEISLDETIRKELKDLPWNSAWSNTTLEDVLRHRAGFADWKNFSGYPLKTKSEVLSAIAGNAPSYVPGSKIVYSDLGFILLGEWIERRSKTALNDVFDREVVKPLDVRTLCFSPLRNGLMPEQIAATEEVPWRGGIIQGIVHDDNALILGEVAGHAGLFGTVADVLQVGFAWLNALCYGDTPFLSRAVAEKFATPWSAEGTSRAIGWDKPSKEASQAGSRVCSDAIGHLGYAGTSLWLDPVTESAVALLTNRVHPTSKNDKIKEFRAKFHDAVWEDTDS